MEDQRVIIEPTGERFEPVPEWKAWGFMFLFLICSVGVVWALILLWGGKL